jgi:hypothetical protein
MSMCKSIKGAPLFVAAWVAMTLTVVVSAFQPAPCPLESPGVTVERVDPGGGGTGGGTGGPPGGKRLKVFP